MARELTESGINYRKEMLRDGPWHNGMAFHFFPHATINWRDWLYYVEEFASKFDIILNISHLAFTKFDPSGKPHDHKNRSLSFKGTKKKLEALGFDNLESISNTSLLDPKDKESDHKCITAISSGYDVDKDDKITDKTRTSYACFMARENLFPFNLDVYLELAKHFHEFTHYSYGYSFRYPTETLPFSYVGGGDGISLTYEEAERVEKWRKFRWSEGRWDASDCAQWWRQTYQLDHLKIQGTTALRDIYKLNFLSHAHMNLDCGGITLEKWIQAYSSRGVLGMLSSNMYYWYIEDENLLVKIRNELGKYGFIVCF